MILVERREHIEAFVKEVVANIDFSEYDPLSVFIDAHKHVAWLGSLVNKIVHLYRVYMAKKMLNLVSECPRLVCHSVTLSLSLNSVYCGSTVKSSWTLCTRWRTA